MGIGPSFLNQFRRKNAYTAWTRPCTSGHSHLTTGVVECPCAACQILSSPCAARRQSLSDSIPSLRLEYCRNGRDHRNSTKAKSNDQMSCFVSCPMFQLSHPTCFQSARRWRWCHPCPTRRYGQTPLKPRKSRTSALLDLDCLILPWSLM